MKDSRPWKGAALTKAVVVILAIRHIRGAAEFGLGVVRIPIGAESGECPLCIWTVSVEDSRNLSGRRRMGSSPDGARGIA